MVSIVVILLPSMVVCGTWHFFVETTMRLNSSREFSCSLHLVEKNRAWSSFNGDEPTGEAEGVEDVQLDEIHVIAGPMLTSKTTVLLRRHYQVLSDNVGSNKYDQRRYKKQKLRELYAGMHNHRIRTRNGGFGCLFCAQRLNPTFASVLAHARGRAIGFFRQKYFRMVAHAAYAEYLEKVYVVGGYD